MDLDDFSDDGLDDLNDNALQELENRALFSTQNPHNHGGLHYTAKPEPIENNYSEYTWDDDDDLDTTEVTDDAGAPVRRPAAGQALPASQSRPLQNAAHYNAISPAVGRHGIPTPNPNWNPNLHMAGRIAPGFPLPQRQLFTTSQVQTTYPIRPQPSQFARPVLPINRFDSTQTSPQQAAPAEAVAALQQKLRELQGELNQARGEAIILRNNSSKTQQQYDVEVTRLKKINADQLSKQERLVQAAVAAEKSANTELQFLQSDIREENVRRKRHQPGSVSGGNDKGFSDIGRTTPRKTAASRSFGMGDGFDEMEMAISPSKGGRRGTAGAVAANIGERTPTKGKRKRPVNDSPIMMLEIDTEEAPAEADPTPVPSLQLAASSGPAPAPTPSYEYLHLVLDHIICYNSPTTFDAFAKLSFPSQPDRTFASIIFEKLPNFANPSIPLQLMVDFSDLLIKLWGKCLEEQFWEPIKYLVSLISFTFYLQTTAIAPGIMVDLVMVAQQTIRPLSEARYRSATGVLTPGDTWYEVEKHIDTTEILSLLCCTAAGCNAPQPQAVPGFSSPIVEFWRLMDPENTVLLLTSKQKTSDVLAMLSLLTTSALPTSLGAISEVDESANLSRAIIDRVSSVLTETRPSVSMAEKRQIRLAVLRTLMAFASHPYGAIQLAQNANALPRLVTCLSLTIDSLYDMTIPPSVLPESRDSHSTSPFNLPLAHESVELNQIINYSVALIHSLVTGPNTSNIAEISAKLSVTFGGSQRYLIALGRLTFAEEDLVMERGIKSDVVEMAHELLEMVVTPEEGTMVSEAFDAV